MNKNLLTNIKEHIAPSSSLPVEYMITATNEIVDGNEVLFLSFWGQRKLKSKAKFKVYLYKGGYVSQKLDENEYKWSNACITNLTGFSWWSSWNGNKNNDKIVCYMLKDRLAISKFFGERIKQFEEYTFITRFQKNIMDERLAIKHKRITDVIDKAMEKVQPLPKGFDKWVYDGPFDFSQYIYYKREGKNINSFCTRCKKEFTINETKHTHRKIKHNGSGTCPMCNKKIIFKATGKTTKQEDRTTFSIIQKYNDGFIIRYFNGVKSYYDHYKKPTIYYHEISRDIININSYKRYEYYYFLMTGQVRWCNDLGKFDISNPYLYTKNLKSILKGTRWQYSCLYEFAKAVKELNAGAFLTQYIRHPGIEYLIKFKLYKLVSDKINTRYWEDINFKGKNIKAIFGFDKNRLEQMQRLNYGTIGLRFVQELEKREILLTDKQIQWVLNNIDNNHNFINLLEYATPHKIIKYAKSQSENIKGYDNILNDWRDYIGQCKELEYDLNESFILYPKNLKERHEEYTLLCNKERLIKYDKGIKKAFNKLQDKYSFSDSKFTIRPVKDLNEIVEEGQKQNHCVAGKTYIEGIVNDNIAIMLLRKNDEINNPFYTVELNLKTLRIVQCRGKGNCDKTPDVIKFINKYEKKFLSKLKKSA